MARYVTFYLPAAYYLSHATCSLILHLVTSLLPTTHYYILLPAPFNILPSITELPGTYYLLPVTDLLPAPTTTNILLPAGIRSMFQVEAFAFHAEETAAA